MSRRLHLGPEFSEGARLAWIAIEKRHWSLQRLEDEMGTSKGLVHRALYGERRPGLGTAVRFHDVLGIDPQLWRADPKKPFTPPAARAA